MIKSVFIQEYLRIFGLRTWVNNLVWITRSMFIYFILTCICAGLSVVVLAKSGSLAASVSKAVFNYSNWTLIWTILFVYAIETSVFAVFFGQLFKRRKIDCRSLSIPFNFLLIFQLYWLNCLAQWFGSSPSSIIIQQLQQDYDTSCAFCRMQDCCSVFKFYNNMNDEVVSAMDFDKSDNMNDRSFQVTRQHLHNCIRTYSIIRCISVFVSC